MPPVLKFDPSDGQAYSFNQLASYYVPSGLMTREQVQMYWDRNCIPVDRQTRNASMSTGARSNTARPLQPSQGRSQASGVPAKAAAPQGGQSAPSREGPRVGPPKSLAGPPQAAPKLAVAPPKASRPSVAKEVGGGAASSSTPTGGGGGGVQPSTPAIVAAAGSAGFGEGPSDQACWTTCYLGVLRLLRGAPTPVQDAPPQNSGAGAAKA
mmetsp:Transcript_87722/g.223280  ORF Transcript_87722/g.223280 Transcript_87722/m.223280 type:complete len:210 (-) Transcript_87722:197-826(-)